MKLHKLTTIYHTQHNKQILERSEGADNVFFPMYSPKILTEKWLQEGLEPSRLAIHRRAKVEYIGKFPMNSYQHRFMFKHIEYGRVSSNYRYQDTIGT